MIVGHGLVERQLLGPTDAVAAPEKRVVQLRRYRCRACDSILVVGPTGIVSRRWYSAGAIGLAVAMYARGQTSSTVRRCVSPSPVVGGSARERWVTLTRWIDAAGRGELFGVRDLRPLTRRPLAKQISLVLAGRAGRQLGEDLAQAAFAGAAMAA